MGFASTFSAFFFFLPAFVYFWRQILLLLTVYALFTHCAYTVHVLKNIKNGSHDTIYTFKYYFATVFSVFSFQFSTTISSIQTHPKCCCWEENFAWVILCVAPTSWTHVCWFEILLGPFNSLFQPLPIIYIHHFPQIKP